MAERQKFQLPNENKVLRGGSEKLTAFIQGTLHEGAPELPWVGLDPKAKPTSGINLRLNEYQIALLRFVAKHEDRSQQHVTKRMLIPALEARVQEIVDEQTPV